MRSTALSELRCPMCGGNLRVDETKLPVVVTQAVYGQEILEALLHCEENNIHYPIIAGVAILVPNPLSYVANNYSTIFKLVSKHISSNMMEYFYKNALDVIGQDSTRAGASGSIQGMGRYIFSHYDDLDDYLSAAHPLRQLLGQKYENWYLQLLRLAEPYLTSKGRALDIASNVGGLAYLLSKVCQFVYGFDFSFAAVLTARRILLAQPQAQDSYRLQIEGAIHQERSITVNRPDNVEFVVASALSIPFEKESFDIVTCANLIDVMPQPDKLLDQISQVMHNQGIFITTDPYFWRTADSDIEQWIGAKDGQLSTAAMRIAISKHFVIVEEQDMVPWILRTYERLYSIHFNHHIVARKNG